MPPTYHVARTPIEPRPAARRLARPRRDSSGACGLPSACETSSLRAPPIAPAAARSSDDRSGDTRIDASSHPETPRRSRLSNSHRPDSHGAQRPAGAAHGSRSGRPERELRPAASGAAPDGDSSPFALPEWAPIRGERAHSRASARRGRAPPHSGRAASFGRARFQAMPPARDRHRSIEPSFAGKTASRSARRRSFAPNHPGDWVDWRSSSDGRAGLGACFRIASLNDPLSLYPCNPACVRSSVGDRAFFLASLRPHPSAIGAPSSVSGRGAHEGHEGHAKSVLARSTEPTAPRRRWRTVGEFRFPGVSNGPPRGAERSRPWGASALGIMESAPSP